MNIPSNPDFYVKAAVSVGVIVGAIVIQASGQEVPDWLTTAFGAIVVFVLGLSTQTHKD